MLSFAEQQIGRLKEGVFRRASPPNLSAGAVERINAAVDWAPLLAAALANPVGEPFPDARRIVVVISDRTRDEPRAEFLAAIERRFPRAELCVLIASGTHGPDPGALPREFAHLSARAHDASELGMLVRLGQTQRGTPVRVARELADADLVFCTGRIRPHYFAGYSGGVKGVFPGLAFREDILKNHLLKAEPGARLGSLDENPCRADMEQAALLLGARLCVLNVLADVDGRPVSAVAGHPVDAHRALCAEARAVFGVPLEPARVLVLADQPPLTCSLYQASKMLAVAELGVLPGGTVILVAECNEGTGPLERVNSGIFELGLRPRLPTGVDVRLVSELPESVVTQTYAAFAPSLESEFARLQVTESEPASLVWRAGECVPERAQSPDSPTKSSRAAL
ncbi:MAG: lactate racemase domain-containing protein [Polyangiaceae bacterium]